MCAWSRRQASNLQPDAYKATALPIELQRQMKPQSGFGIGGVQSQKSFPSVQGKGLAEEPDRQCMWNPCGGKRVQQNGANDQNRTGVFSLEGCCSTVELHPQEAMLQGAPPERESQNRSRTKCDSSPLDESPKQQLADFSIPSFQFQIDCATRKDEAEPRGATPKLLIPVIHPRGD